MKLCYGCDSDLCLESGCQMTTHRSDILDWGGYDERKHEMPGDDQWPGPENGPDNIR